MGLGSGLGLGLGLGLGFGLGMHAACTRKPTAASPRKVGSSAAHAPSHARDAVEMISEGEIPWVGLGLGLGLGLG